MRGKELLQRWLASRPIDILRGDVLHAAIPKGLVHCAVTSPPYYKLRDYGDPNQLGNEATPELYVEALVSRLRVVKEALRDDGTLWLNISDSYAGKGQKSGAGRKSKDLIGIPWMVAEALRADGWYWRQDIVWSKRNGTPESVPDRCTKSHEYIMLFSKSKSYYFDYKAIEEEGIYPAGTKAAKGSVRRKKEAFVNGRPPEYAIYSGMRRKRSVWHLSTKPYNGAHFAVFPDDLIEPCILAGCPEGGTVLDPFAGSGTTAGVALRNGREAILCELNSDYIDELMPRRIYTVARSPKRDPIPQKRALKMFGERVQLLKLAEECSELSAAIIKHLTGVGNTARIISKAGDVALCLKYIELIFSTPKFSAALKRSENKLSDYLDSKEEECLPQKNC